MKKLLFAIGLFGLLATQPATSCKKKEKKTKVVKYDRHETKGYKIERKKKEVKQHKKEHKQLKHLNKKKEI